MKKWKRITPAVLIILSVLLNIIARWSRTFSDYYVNQIFPLWVETYGRVTGLFPFSVGEWMLYLAVLLIVLLLLGGFASLLLWRCSPKSIFFSKWRKGYKNYAFFLYWVFGVVCVIMTLNCFLLYQASPITERFKIGAGAK